MPHVLQNPGQQLYQTLLSRSSVYSLKSLNRKHLHLQSYPTWNKWIYIVEIFPGLNDIKSFVLLNITGLRSLRRRTLSYGKRPFKGKRRVVGSSFHELHMAPELFTTGRRLQRPTCNETQILNQWNWLNHFDAKTGLSHFYALLKFPLFKTFYHRIAWNWFYFSNQFSTNKISKQ